MNGGYQHEIGCMTDTIVCVGEGCELEFCPDCRPSPGEADGLCRDCYEAEPDHETDGAA